MLSKAEVDAIKLKQLEDARKPQPGILDNPIVKTLIGAGTGYLAGGLLPAIISGLPAATPVAGPVTAAQSAAGMTTLPGVGGGVGAALSARPETLLPAIQGGLKGIGAKTPEEAAVGGIKEGALPTIQAGETAAMNKFGLVPSTVKGATGDISYAKPTPTISEQLRDLGAIQGLKIPGMNVSATGGKNPQLRVSTQKPAAGKPTAGMSAKAATVFQAAQARANKGEDINAIVADVNATTSITTADKAKVIAKLKGSKKPGITTLGIK